MDSQAIRDTFLRFFEERGHKRMPSAPLLQVGDPTLRTTFTTAGMVQFKPFFEGRATPPSKRLASVQKCFRTSDIDSVGDTGHLTFFEMLGNFSIGDYFKEKAIPWAWELVTGKEWFGMDPDRLWAAVYLDDDEAFDLWRKVDVPAERIKRYGEEDNYWFSGDVGPCGPCSEIYYDYGKKVGCGRDDCEPVHDCGRFLEIWNLVFMTHFQHPDGSRTPLPTKNIDTGAGLERMAAVLQGVPSVYDTDLFQPIISRIEELSGRRYGEDEATDRAMRVVAEHTRAAAFLLAEGIAPSSDERGYAVRRVLRRAVYFARGLGVHRDFAGAIPAVADTLWSPGYGSHPPYHILYPDLSADANRVQEVLEKEEERFAETMTRGAELLDEVLERTKANRMSRLSANDVFLLHDTYGFPMELTREIARERGFTIDEEGFEREMEAQRERARAARHVVIHAVPATASAEALPAEIRAGGTEFLGYETLTAETTVVGLLRDGGQVESASEGDAVEVILRETPFYGEAGGQVGDTGEIVGPDGRVQVDDTQRPTEKLIVHVGRVVEGRIAVNDAVVARVDEARRLDIMRNHTATHLLHAALRQVLGSRVRQAGSLVAPDRLRFDFTHMEAIKPEELAEIQRIVNEKIRADLPVTIRLSSFDAAREEGVLAFFDETYGDQVRVVETKEDGERVSGELCGGTHCSATGQIGLLLIVGESSIGAGMRRIEAITGRGAEAYVQEQLAALESASRRLGAAPADLESKAASLLSELDSERKRVQALERALAAPAAEALVGKAEAVDGIPLLAERVDAPSQDALRHMGDVLRQRLGSAVVVLGTVLNGRPAFMAMVTPDLVKRGLHADHILKRVASAAGGGGGGRPEMAQGGGTDAGKLDEALGLVEPLVREFLAKKRKS